jgi:hypothetical protein
MPPSLEADNARAAPASPIMLGPAGAASQDVLPLGARQVGSRVASYRVRSPPGGSGRPLFPKRSSQTSWASEDAASSVLSHESARGLRGPDVALRISLRVFS